MKIGPLIALMCGFLGLTLLGMHAVPALLPLFTEIWSLSHTEAGWIAGIPYLTYLIGVSFVGVTDRVDAQGMLIIGALINVAGYGGMGFADGFWSAMFFRNLQGLGLAWTFMPGVKAIADRVAGGNNISGKGGRATSLYVSSFAVCSSFSLVIAAEISTAFGWQWAFRLAMGLCPAGHLQSGGRRPDPVFVTARGADGGPRQYGAIQDHPQLPAGASKPHGAWLCHRFLHA